jgi:hypothetical protein
MRLIATEECQEKKGQANARLAKENPSRGRGTGFAGPQAAGCGSKPACAGLDSLQMRCLWRRGALQGQRITRSEKRGGYNQPCLNFINLSLTACRCAA